MIANEAQLQLLVVGSGTITDNERALLLLSHRKAESALKRYLRYDPEQKVHTELVPRNLPHGSARDGGGIWEPNAGHTRAVFTALQTDIRESLQLRHLPIREVTLVQEDSSANYGQAPGAFGTSFTAGTDYYVEFDEAVAGSPSIGLCNTGNLLVLSAWPSTTGSVRVTYRAGYSRAELDGEADETSVAADGTVTMAGVDAYGLVEFVQLTAVGHFLKLQGHQKKSKIGFTTGPIESERLQDYSYKLGGGTTGGAAGAGLGSLRVDIPPEAKRAVQEYRHYGEHRL